MVVCSVYSAAGERLIVFHAGSLSVPFKKISDEFSKIYPDVDIRLSAAGSRDCARKISDLKLPCDILASADYAVINELLIPQYADWNIKFMANEMSIVYHQKSRRNKEINSTNWYEILMDNSVIYGRSDPNSDPCGYRAIFVMQLAEEYYSKSGLKEAMLKKNTNFIRPKETDLLALLESGSVDYIFLYRSVAYQHGLNFVKLPDEINLNNPEMAEFYKSAEVELQGKSPGKLITQRGEPIVYGITIPKSASNRCMAIAFVKYLLSPEGQETLKQTGHSPLRTPLCKEKDKLPDELKEFVSGE
ncbi:MAG: tungstate ABC transporter substrate-binding protein WtpA [Candidatus Nanoarchaeia archaeon]